MSGVWTASPKVSGSVIVSDSKACYLCNEANGRIFCTNVAICRGPKPRPTTSKSCYFGLVLHSGNWCAIRDVQAGARQKFARDQKITEAP